MRICWNSKHHLPPATTGLEVLNLSNRCNSDWSETYDKLLQHRQPCVTSMDDVMLQSMFTQNYSESAPNSKYKPNRSRMWTTTLSVWIDFLQHTPTHTHTVSSIVCGRRRSPCTWPSFVCRPSSHRVSPTVIFYWVFYVMKTNDEILVLRYQLGIPPGRPTLAIDWVHDTRPQFPNSFSSSLAPDDNDFPQFHCPWINVIHLSTPITGFGNISGMCQCA